MEEIVLRKDRPETGKVLELFRRGGFRITKQRKLVLDIVLEGKCGSCKDVYCRAKKKDESIGMATVYRNLQLLEDMRLLSRVNRYQMSGGQPDCGKRLKICLDNRNTVTLTEDEWTAVLRSVVREKTGDNGAEAVSAEIVYN